MDNVDLIRKAQKGDKEALIKYIMNRKDEYYRLAYVYVKNKEDALDALQEMIVTVYLNIKKLKKVDVFLSWSKTILVNCCKGIIRKRNKLILIDHYEDEAYVEKYESVEQSMDIEKCLEKLNFAQKEAIKLKYYIGLDYETIAEITKTPVGTVKSRIYNGVKILKEIMEKSGG